MKLNFPKVGDLIGGAYQIERVLGRGGWAVVYEALQLRMRRRVAIKMLTPQYADNELTLMRFEQEALLATHLRHPHIVELYDTGRTHDGVPYIVMESLSGRTVKDLVHENPDGVSTRRMLHIVRQILQALDAAHAQGVLHRDIKPSNIFLCTFSGTDDYVKLLDFGIAKVFSREDGSGLAPIDTVQLGGGIVGSPRYMAPEAFKELPLTPSADLFSVGLIMAELLGGRPVLEGDTELEVIGRLCSDVAFDFVGAVKQSPVFPVIEKVLSKAPAARYQSAREMLEALTRYSPSSAIDMPMAPVTAVEDLGATVPLDTAMAVAAASERSPLEQAEAEMESAPTFAFNTEEAIRQHEAREQAGRASKHGGPGMSEQSLQTSVPGRTRNMGRDGRREAAAEALERVPAERAPTQMVVAPPEPPRPPKKSNAGVMIGVIAAVVLVFMGALCAIGVLGALFWRTSPPESVPAVEHPPTIVSAASSQRVRVSSMPDGATVRLDGRALGVTPLEIDPAAVGGGQTLELEISLDGYASQSVPVDVSSGGDQSIAVSLVATSADKADDDEDDEAHDEDDGDDDSDDDASPAAEEKPSDDGKAVAKPPPTGGGGAQAPADKAGRGTPRAGSADPSKKPAIKGGGRPLVIPKID